MPLLALLAMVFGLIAYTTMPPPQPPPKIVTSSRDGAPKFPVDVSHLKNATPKYEPKSNFGNPPDLYRRW